MTLCCTGVHVERGMLFMVLAYCCSNEHVIAANLCLTCENTRLGYNMQDQPLKGSFSLGFVIHTSQEQL